MEVPVGFIAKLWSFLSFIPFFLLLLTLGLLKGVIISPVAGGIIGIGNSAVIIGLWPAHFIWTCYCVAKAKRLGLVLKILVLVLLPLPLVLWPIWGVVCSFLGGIAYAFFAPLLATFEAVGENVADKLFHCFVDGCWSTIKGSFTVVQDFTDFCFHSYFSYMDELSEDIPADQKPIDIKLTKLPICLLAILIGLIVDVPMITVVALWKSPYMLFKGWKRLLEDLIGREGPFLETVCIPFAALSIVLWPLAVVGAVISAFFSSLFLALYSAVIVHQEDSFRMGLAYIVAVISLFDEYANDLLYLREGSCFLRPRYRRNMSPGDSIQRRKSIDRVRTGQKNGREGSTNSKLVSERSWTLKCAIEQYTPIQIWDWLFKSCKVNGRILLHEGLIDVKDLEECILKGKSEKLGIKLPAWTLLQCLLASAKSDSSGLLIYDNMELTRTNCPKERLFEWFIEPLFVMKQQIKGLRLNEDEEICLKKLIMQCKNDKPEEWDDIGFPSSDTVRRAQLQAIIRRLQGIVCSMSRMPTFRRRFKNLVKVLCIEAIESGTLSNDVGGRLKTGYGGNQKNGEATTSDASEHKVDDWNIV
ncbi:uncharacterized membrane protein At3g27390 isoform X1 [Actinidia eriantha]|uniref:uncharacterized membrane protein At3g27390 isoform X1 n=1 Tax=Actinidia eriantha TaxID=165200 RepID=UPI0025851CEA|nr:uncharacterized membrane protein At3g27390 isoform X1 [Actinidia eriantha]